MNKNIKIRVKTAVGTSEPEVIGPILAQGSPKASIISFNNVDVRVREAIDDKTKEIKY